jgi:YegS/Rv2252/BmrU family lipid kinase
VTKRALLIYNPAARRAPDTARLATAAAAVHGWEVTLQPTDAAGHATALAARASADAFDAVVACGGDGTVNEVANGLASSSTALAVIRGGTANVWAKEIGVRKGPEAALRLLTDGEVRAIDLGRAGERYFVCMAGVGFDAAIVREMLTSSAKQRVGAAAYVWTGFRLVSRYKPGIAELQFDGETTSSPLFWLMVANSRNYGGVLDIAHMAKIDDGRLESLLLRQGGLWTLAKLLPLVFLKRHHRGQMVVHRSIESLEVRTEGLPVQLDGEYAGETPLRFTVADGALRVLVPAGLHSPLFSKTHSLT